MSTPITKLPKGKPLSIKRSDGEVVHGEVEIYSNGQGFISADGQILGTWLEPNELVKIIKTKEK